MTSRSILFNQSLESLLSQLFASRLHPALEDYRRGYRVDRRLPRRFLHRHPLEALLRLETRESLVEHLNPHAQRFGHPLGERPRRPRGRTLAAVHVERQPDHDHCYLALAKHRRNSLEVALERASLHDTQRMRSHRSRIGHGNPDSAPPKIKRRDRHSVFRLISL